MENYENSFANFCGINKFHFKEIYIKNRYTPILNKFGDINIFIKSIIDILNNFSFSLEMKIHRRFKRNRKNKVFKIFKNKLNKNQNIFEIKNKNKKFRITRTKKIKIDNLNNQNSKYEFGLIKNDKIDYLKKGLTTSIEKNNNNKIQELDNNSNKSITKKNPNIIVYKDLVNKDIEASLNNIGFNKQRKIFNFFSKDDQNSENINIIDSSKKKIPPFKINSNSNIYHNSISYNNKYNSLNLSPSHILSPSIHNSYSDISSPFNLQNYSPFYPANMDRYYFNTKNNDLFDFENYNSNHVIIENNYIVNNSNINNKIINRNINNKIEKIISINSNDIINNKKMNPFNQNSIQK